MPFFKIRFHKSVLQPSPAGCLYTINTLGASDILKKNPAGYLLTVQSPFWFPLSFSKPCIMTPYKHRFRCLWHSKPCWVLLYNTDTLLVCSCHSKTPVDYLYAAQLPFWVPLSFWKLGCLYTRKKSLWVPLLFWKPCWVPLHNTATLLGASDIRQT